MNQNETIPESVLKYIRTRSNRNESSRFPHKLWTLLNWSDKNQKRGELCGCGWITDTEFFIKKSKLCEVLEIKINTLNVNLKTLGFHPTRSRTGDITYWENNGFSKTSCPQDFERIRNSRCKPLALKNLLTSAVYLPLLEQLQLFMMDQPSINLFKKEVVQVWESLVGPKLIFAVELNDFQKALVGRFEKLGFYPSKSLFPQVLSPKLPNVIDIFDFAVFLARFGPFEHAVIKLFQYQTVLNEIRPDFFMFNTPSLTSYFSMTFHNCFRFQLAQTGEYHCYNLPTVSSTSGFLADEDGAIYQSWKLMLQQNYFLATQNV
ncbi:39 kDa initiator binding protein [Histomonas meleagridis]|uniref:39 kDa initiator binding protein n=1 Tax=Histomonas meleagridis TaxID=135588 RepID=UPI003559A24A|nr:39 kDa initiator binding protein [Histomonas meleagridis]KAH0799412.1 39 kDa initiator binding protein [Histomonas meleagridis]